MNNNTPGLSLERAAEQIRQERETFEQRKRHEHMWFGLRLAMGISSIILLAAIMVLCAVILLNPSSYPVNVVTAAGVALLTDVLGLLIGVWKIVLNSESITQLEPVTNVGPSFFGPEEEHAKTATSQLPAPLDAPGEGSVQLRHEQSEIA